jgi:hypothetical protein
VSLRVLRLIFHTLSALAKQIYSPLVDESVSRSLQYYTITFSATGLFILLCMVILTSAEYFRSKKILMAIIPGAGNL